MRRLQLSRWVILSGYFSLLGIYTNRSWSQCLWRFVKLGCLAKLFLVESDSCTVLSLACLQVHSANRHGILLNVVQVLTDLDLKITKSDIFSDGGWFMDGKFHR